MATALDFIDALRQHPQFHETVLRHLLTAGLLRLPEQVKQLGKDFLEHREEFPELRNQFIKHRKEFLEYARMTDERLVALESSQEELRQGQKELRTDMDSLKATVVQIGGTVSRLDGANYENQAADYAPRRLRTVLGLSQPIAIATPRERTALHAIADQAAVSGVISDDEADDLLLTDIAFAATGPGGAKIQVIAEASITAQARDCDRAVIRAGIMGRATGTPTIPVVISAEAPDELVQARQHEVTFFNIPNND